jgi:purine-binding chemotaxis protein CheW
VNLVDLRGRVVVAVSLRQRLGAPPASARESIAIGFESRGELFALLADRVGDVLSLPESARTPLPPHCDAAHSRYMRELYKCDAGLIPILDVERLFDFD